MGAVGRLVTKDDEKDGSCGARFRRRVLGYSDFWAHCIATMEGMMIMVVVVLLLRENRSSNNGWVGLGIRTNMEFSFNVGGVSQCCFFSL